MKPYSARRRHLAGPTGCGLCGIGSLSEASRPGRRVGAGLHVAPEPISTAMAALPPAQMLNRETRAPKPPASGSRTTESSRFARMSAVTLPSTSWWAHSPTGRSTEAAALCFSPAAFRSKWCKRPPLSAPQSSWPCPCRRRGERFVPRNTAAFFRSPHAWTVSLERPE